MLNMTMGEEEEVMEESGVTSVSDLIIYINSMNREELVEYLAENLEDEVDPQAIREMTDENVKEYKRLFIAALTADNDNNTIATTATAEESIWSHDQKEELSSRHEMKEEESPETEINVYNITIIKEARLQVPTEEDEVVNRHKDEDNTMKMTTLKEQTLKRADATPNSVVSEIPLLPSTSFPSENNTCELPITPCISTIVPENNGNTTMTTLKEQILKKPNNGAESTPAKPIQHSSWSSSSSEGEEVVKIVKRPRVVYNSNGIITAEPPMIEVIVLDDDDDDDPADCDNNKIGSNQRENRDCTRGPCLDAFSISSNAGSPSLPKVSEDIVADDDHNLFDNINDLTSNKILSNNRISCNDSDLVDKYCGAGLAKIRMGSHNDDDPLQPIFESGYSYDRQSLEGKCNLGVIIQKENLTAHANSSSHRKNLMDISSELIDKQQQQQQPLSKVILDLTDDESNDISDRRRTDDAKEDDTRPNFKEGKSNRLEPSVKKSKLDLVSTLRSTWPSSLSSCARRRSSSSRNHRRMKRSSGSRHYERRRSPRSDSSTSRSKSRTNRRSRSNSRKPKRERRKRSRSMSPPRGYRSPPARYRRRRSHSSSLTSVSSSSSIRNSHRRRRLRSSSSHSPSPSRQKASTLQEKIDTLLKTNTRRSQSSLPTPSDSLNDSDNWMVGLRAKMGEHEIFKEKLALQAHGKWTNELEKCWKKMELDQEEVKRTFTKEQAMMMDKLQKQDVYVTELKKFWDKRYKQLVKEEGQSVANSYDYIEEWKVEWEFMKRRILQDNYHQKILAIRVKHGMNLDSLTAIHTQASQEKTLNGANNGQSNQPVSLPSNVVVVSNTSNRFFYSFSPLPLPTPTPPAPILPTF